MFSASHKRRRTRPKAVADVIASVLGEAEGQPKRRRPSIALRVFKAYDALGPPFNLRADPVHYRRGTLTLMVEDSTWLTELSFLREELTERLNAKLGEDKITAIRFRHGPLNARQKPETRPRAEPPMLSPERQAWLQALGARVSDPEVRAAMLRAARWSKP